MFGSYVKLHDLARATQLVQEPFRKPSLIILQWVLSFRHLVQGLALLSVIPSIHLGKSVKSSALRFEVSKVAACTSCASCSSGAVKCCRHVKESSSASGFAKAKPMSYRPAVEVRLFKST